jgi:hypothetical protein
VQPVRELDQKHAHIVGDRQQQCAEIFSLLGLFGDEVEFFEFGESFNQTTYAVAE